MDENDQQVICRHANLVDGGTAARFAFELDGRILNGFTVAYDGQVYAYANSCPHRGTELDWLPGKVFDDSGLYLVCATHGAIFEVDSGKCVGGPCHGASLVKVAIRVVNDVVTLAVGRLISTQPPPPPPPTE